jgi:hypothetical protein
MENVTAGVCRCVAFRAYFAQVERLPGNQEMRTGQDEDGIRRDLESLESAVGKKTLAS